jgi:hypothetical protein
MYKMTCDSKINLLYNICQNFVHKYSQNWLYFSGEQSSPWDVGMFIISQFW